MLLQAAPAAGPDGEADAGLVPSAVRSEPPARLLALRLVLYQATIALKAGSKTGGLAATGDVHVRVSDTGAPGHEPAGDAQSGRVPNVPHVPSGGAGSGGRHERPWSAR